MNSESFHALNDFPSLFYWVQSVFPYPALISIPLLEVLLSLPLSWLTSSHHHFSLPWSDCQTSLLDSDHFCWSIPIEAASVLFLKSNQILSLSCLKPFTVSDMGIRNRPGHQAIHNQTLANFLGFVVFRHPIRTISLLQACGISYILLQSSFFVFYCFKLLYIISLVPGLSPLPGKLLLMLLPWLLDTLPTFFPRICHAIV